MKKGNQIFDVWFDNSLTWDYVLQKDAHSLNDATSNLNQELAALGISMGQEEQKPEQSLPERSGGRRGIKSLKAYMAKKKGSVEDVNSA